MIPSTMINNVLMCKNKKRLSLSFLSGNGILSSKPELVPLTSRQRGYYWIGGPFMSTCLFQGILWSNWINAHVINQPFLLPLSNIVIIKEISPLIYVCLFGFYLFYFCPYTKTKPAERHSRWPFHLWAKPQDRRAIELGQCWVLSLFYLWPPNVTIKVKITCW